MACTFDSPCLTSQVNGVQPTFGFNPHNTGLFGIQASFTHGSKTCYTHASPTWQPVIQSGAYAATCTWIGAVESIYCPNLPVSQFGYGPHTLTYSVPHGSPAPFIPTTFNVGHPKHTRPDQPIVATDYVTVTRPSATSTKTYTSTIEKNKTVVQKSGTKYVPGPTQTETKYTAEKPHAEPTVTTFTAHYRTTKTKTVTTTTSHCGYEEPGKPEGGQQGGPPSGEQGGAPEGGNWGEQKPGQQGGKPEGGEPNWGGKPEGGEPNSGGEGEGDGKPDWANLWNGKEGGAQKRNVAIPQMNTAAVETVSAGQTMRVPIPCKGKCGGWSGPDATFTGGKQPQKPKETITWTKTTTKYSGVKYVPTTTTTYKVDVTVKKVPETTKVVPKKTTTTKTVPPKFTPHWTKTVTTVKTWTKYTATTLTKTVPCKVKTVTSLETKTFVETVNAPEGGEWGGFNGRATATAIPAATATAEAAEECQDCHAAQNFNWSEIARERAASLEAAQPKNTKLITLTGARLKSAVVTKSA